MLSRLPRPVAVAAYVLTSVSVSADPVASPLSLGPCRSPSWAGAVVIIPARPMIWTPRGLHPGDTIAAVTGEGQCLGSTTWKEGGAALMVWADDPLTPAVDGFREGDPLTLVAWDDGLRADRRAGDGTDWMQAAYAYPVYEPTLAPTNGLVRGGVFVVRSSDAGAPPPHPDGAGLRLPESVEFAAPFPNPARTVSHFPLSLPAESEVTVEVFDARGREVAVVMRGTLGPGSHRLPADVTGLASGVYVARLRVGPEVRHHPFVVAR